MLTPKEIKFLNYLLKRLKNQHLGYNKTKEFIKKNFKLNDKDSFELAYLYDKNFEDAEDFVVNREGDGTNQVVDFNNVAEPERMSYEEYQEKMPWQVKAVMEVVEDEDPDNYEFDGYDTVEHDGTEYRIYESYDDLENSARDLYDPCDEVEYEYVSETYFYITDTDRRLTADDEANIRVDNMSDEDIISDAGIEDKIDALDELEDLKSQIEEKTEEMEDLVHQLDDADEDEKTDLEERIANFESEIEDLESKVEDIESGGTRDEIIDTAREELRSNYYDQTYDELGDDPIGWFRDHGTENISDMPVQLDCDSYSDDFFSNQDTEGLVYNTGHSSWQEVNVEGKGYVYVVWD